MTSYLACGAPAADWPRTGLEKWFERWRGLGLGGPRKRVPKCHRGPKTTYITIGCPRIILTCIFPQLSVLRWNHWRCGYQNFLKNSSKGKAKCHTPPKSPHDPVQSLFPVSAQDLFSLCAQVPNRQLLTRGAFPDSTIERLTSYLLEGLQIKCETSWISVALKNFQQLKRAKTKSGLIGKPGRYRKSRPFPDATKVIAIAAEKCYQKTCKLSNNQNGMARNIFVLFVCQILIERCVVSLQLAILIKISRKAANALLQTKREEEMLENLGATDIQLIPHFALRLSSKYHANGSVVEAGVALLANTLLPVWSLSKKRKTIPQR